MHKSNAEKQPNLKWEKYLNTSSKRHKNYQKVCEKIDNIANIKGNVNQTLFTSLRIAIIKKKRLQMLARMLEKGSPSTLLMENNMEDPKEISNRLS